MNRRHFLQHGVIVFSALLIAPYAWGKEKMGVIVKSDAEWRSILTKGEYRILRQAGTEPSGSSRLNGEKREGDYLCVGCDLHLFGSSMKYDSGTGWPSFKTVIPGRVDTSTDYKLLYPRTEYHCARCGGHQGHLFNDGPAPTGNRYCNNGLALRFLPTHDKDGAGEGS